MEGLVYVTGPADTKPSADRLMTASHNLSEGELHGGVIACPILNTGPDERLRTVLDAALVVLSPDWATDIHARRDAQVAVWAGKPIKQYDPLSTLKGSGGSSLRVLTAEAVQTVLDRGLSLALAEEDTRS